MCQQVITSLSACLMGKFSVNTAGGHSDRQLSGMRPRATLQGMVGYSLRAGHNPFTGQTRPATRMLPMPVLDAQYTITSKIC